MIYASLDLETTGLDPATCDIVELGIVIDDLANPKPLHLLPSFHCYVRPWGSTYRGEPYVLSMHHEIFRRIAKAEPPYDYVCPDTVAIRVAEFLRENHVPFGEVPGDAKLTCAGKNFASFDLPFLQRLPNWDDQIAVAHRSLDPGSMYVRATDSRIPDMTECCKRAGIEWVHAHTAIGDALAVVQLVRHALGVFAFQSST